MGLRSSAAWAAAATGVEKPAAPLPAPLVVVVGMMELEAVTLIKAIKT